MSAGKRERIIIDVDGVLRDYIASLNAVYAREYPGHEILPVTDWELARFYPLGEEIYRFADEQFAREILENAPAYPGAIPELHQMEKEFEIVIATTQPPQHRYPTLVWLGKNHVPSNEIHITAEKQRIAGFVLLDDYPVNLRKFEATGRLAVCMDRPWNQDWTGPRVKSVGEFHAFLNVYLHDFDEDPGILLA